MKKKILLIEDNEFLSEVYLSTLENEYDVTVAHDGKEGLKYAQRGGFDLILLDIILPEIDGLDVVKQLKEKSPSSPNNAIVFLTSLDNDDQVQEAKKLADGYIMKSEITPGDLLQEIQKYIH